MTRFAAWVQASRLPSQTYIAFPILFGQMVAFAAGFEWSWIGFALAQAFGLFDQLYIVYANDWADVETDAGNETFNIFSGGSRVIVEGRITRRAIGRAAIVMATLAAGVGVALWAYRGTPVPLVLIVVGLALLWAYSYPPVRMSYRGGGEVLQMLGVGGVLPLVGFVAQGAPLGAFPWAMLGVSLPISLGCAVATSLPDEPSDRSSQKFTGSVTLGPVPAQTLVLVLVAASLATWLLLPAVAAAGVPAPIGRAAAAIVPVIAYAAGVAKRGGVPGSARLTSFVTLMVATNVTFFLALAVSFALA